MNNNNRLTALRESIHHAVINNCLHILNPLFDANPKPEKVGKGIHIKYKSKKEWSHVPENPAPSKEHREDIAAMELFAEPLGQEKPCFWLVISNEQFAIRLEDNYEVIDHKIIKGKDGDDINLRNIAYAPDIKIFQSMQIPVYIKTFMDAAKKTFKKSIILISEMLPFNSFSIWIYTNFDSKKQNTEALEMIASYAIESDEENIEDKIKEIIENDKKSFYRKLDEVLNLNSESTEQPDYSYCLCCGYRINYKSKFCNGDDKENSEILERDNCLHKFKYWIKFRLEITDNKVSFKLREKYYNEMSMLVAKYRFSAYEIFQENNTQLFKTKKRGRKAIL